MYAPIVVVHCELSPPQRSKPAAHTTAKPTNAQGTCWAVSQSTSHRRRGACSPPPPRRSYTHCEPSTSQRRSRSIWRKSVTVSESVSQSVTSFGMRDDDPRGPALPARGARARVARHPHISVLLTSSPSTTLPPPLHHRHAIVCPCCACASRHHCCGQRALRSRHHAPERAVSGAHCGARWVGHRVIVVLGGAVCFAADVHPGVPGSSPAAVQQPADAHGRLSNSSGFFTPACRALVFGPLPLLPWWRGGLARSHGSQASYCCPRQWRTAGSHPSQPLHAPASSQTSPADVSRPGAPGRPPLRQRFRCQHHSHTSTVLPTWQTPFAPARLQS